MQNAAAKGIAGAAKEVLGTITPEDLAAVEHIHRLVALWDAGDVDAAVVRRETTGRQLCIAVLRTPLDWPLRAAFMRLLDDLIDGATGPGGDRYYRTNHGVMSHNEVVAMGARVTHTERGVLIEFPERVPWLRRPAPDIGDAGERGDPVYRSDRLRGPIADISARTDAVRSAPRHQPPDMPRYDYSADDVDF